MSKHQVLKNILHIENARNTREFLKRVFSFMCSGRTAKKRSAVNTENDQILSPFPYSLPIHSRCVKGENKVLILVINMRALVFHSQIRDTYS